MDPLSVHTCTVCVSDMAVLDTDSVFRLVQ